MGTEAYIEMVYRNLKGDLSPDEFAALNEATAKNAELAALRIDIEDAWDVSGSEETVVSKTETDDLFQKIVKGDRSTTILSLRNIVTSIAAMFILALGSIWLLRDQTEIYTEEGLVTLADNSTVELRKGSRLEVNSFTDMERNVTLKGEAFFQISKDQKRPFIVSTAKAKIEVLGTSFLIKEASGFVFVDLKEGSVKFSSKRSTSESLIMTKGMQASYSDDNGLKEVHYPNLSAWKNGMYQYQDKFLYIVVEELAMFFDTRIIVLDDQLPNCTISAILTADNLEDILNQLAVQLEMNVKQSGNIWVLSGGKCK